MLWGDPNPTANLRPNPNPTPNANANPNPNSTRSAWCSTGTPPHPPHPSRHHHHHQHQHQQPHLSPSPSPQHPLTALVAVHPANTLPAAAIPRTPHSALSRAVAAGAEGWLSVAQLTAWLVQVKSVRRPWVWVRVWVGWGLRWGLGLAVREAVLVGLGSG